MQCKEWDDANSELFKESHDEAVHKNSYKSRLYELISASLGGLGSKGLVPIGDEGFNRLTGPLGRRVLKLNRRFVSEGCGGGCAANI